MRYAERFASPTVIGRFDSKMTSAEVDDFYTTLTALQDQTTIVMPDAAKVELIQAIRDSSDTYENILNMLNLWIGRAILVPDLLGVSGSKTIGGSLALGKEQFGLFQSMVEKDRRLLAKKINLKLIRPLVTVNFGDQYKCEFEFRAYDSGEQNQLMDMWIRAVNGGAFRPNADEINYFRRNVGFPEGDVEIPEKPLLPKSETDRFSNSIKFSKARDFTPYESKIDFEMVERELDRSEKSVVPALLAISSKIASDLIDQIRSKKIVEDFKPEKINDLEIHFRKEMNDAVRVHFISIFRNGVEQAKKEIFGNAVDKFSEIDPDDFEDIIRADSFKLVGDITSRILRRSQDEILSGIKDGASLGKIVTAIKDKVLQENENYIIATVRTRTTEIFNQSRKTFYETDDIAKEIVVGYQFSAVMDERTTPVCASLDQKIFEKGEFVDRVVPPLHFSCRSLLVPITRFEKVEQWDKPKNYEWLKNHGAGLVQKFTQENR